jgi:hypothetical protein
MIRLARIMVAGLLIASPAMAAPWVAGYQMATFTAGAGSDEEGWLSLECGDPDAGTNEYGELYLLFTPGAGISFNKKQQLTYLTFTIGSDTFDLPIELEAGSSNTLSYVREAEGSILTQGLVSSMRNGERVQISLDGQQLGDLSLEGSGEALEAIDECIRYRS